MRLALASQPVKNGEVEWNVQRMEDVLRACRGRADAVVFGESVLQGFDCLCWDYARDCAVAAALTDEPVRHLQAAARENGTAVSFGMIERAADGLYSSQVFLGADGRCGLLCGRRDRLRGSGRGERHFVCGTVNGREDHAGHSDRAGVPPF